MYRTFQIKFSSNYDKRSDLEKDAPAAARGVARALAAAEQKRR